MIASTPFHAFVTIYCWNSPGNAIRAFINPDGTLLYYLYVLFLFQSVLRPTSIITLHFFRFSFSAAHGARVRNLPYFFTLCSGSISLLYRPESDSSYSIYETPLIRRIIQSYAQEQGIPILDLNISKINWFLWLFVDFLRSSVACAGRTDG